MKRKINLFALSLLTMSIIFFTACNKNNPTPETDCSNFEVVITQVANSNDQLIATASGADSPYSYLWSDSTTENTITTNPSGGTYSVTATSADGCTATATFEVTVDPCTYFEASITLQDSSLVANSSGGLAPYTYIWSTGETDANIFVWQDGNYGLTITDANGCTATADFDYILDPCANSDLEVTVELFTDPAGNFLQATVSGGTAPYSYIWSSGQANAIITAPAAGLYTITVIDANGCSATANYTVAAGCGDFLVDIVKNDSITTSIHFDALTTAGTAPFSYQWGGFGTGTNSWTELNLGTSGPISVTVTDANGCIASDNDQF